MAEAWCDDLALLALVGRATGRDSGEVCPRDVAKSRLVVTGCEVALVSCSPRRPIPTAWQFISAAHHNEMDTTVAANERSGSGV